MWIRKKVHGWIRQKVHGQCFLVEVRCAEFHDQIWVEMHRKSCNISYQNCQSTVGCWLSALLVLSLSTRFPLCFLQFVSDFLFFVCVFFRSRRQWPWHGGAGRAGRVSVSEGLHSILDLRFVSVHTGRHWKTGSTALHRSVSLPRLTPPALPEHSLTEYMAIYCNLWKTCFFVSLLFLLR